MKLVASQPRTALLQRAAPAGCQPGHFVIPRGVASRPVVGFIAVSDQQNAQSSVSELLDAAGVVTLKEYVMETAAFKTFQQAVESKVQHTLLRVMLWNEHLCCVVKEHNHAGWHPVGTKTDQAWQLAA